MSFDDADFYTTVRDAERFTAQSPEEAIGECAPVRCPVTVYAHKRRVVTREWVEATALSLTENMRELYDDEYGDPDGEYEDQSFIGFDDDITTALETFAAAVKPFICNPCGERTYTDNEVRAMGIEVTP